MKKPSGPSTAESPRSGLDIRAIEAIAKIAGSYDLSEIEVEHGGMHVRVARERAPVAASPAQVYAAPAPVAAAAAPSTTAEAKEVDHAGVVKSPMVGTAYLRPSPDAKPFVEVGTVVKAGEKIMLVEAMKTFNEIVAPRAGAVTQIFVEDGSPVEYGQSLMVIE